MPSSKAKVGDYIIFSRSFGDLVTAGKSYKIISMNNVSYYIQDNNGKETRPHFQHPDIIKIISSSELSRTLYD